MPRFTARAARQRTAPGAPASRPPNPPPPRRPSETRLGRDGTKPARTMGAMRDEATFRTKAGLAEMLKGGVIMDVVTAEQAKIAEDAGAAAVMALERVPADIRRDGGVARMSDPSMIKGIQE